MKELIIQQKIEDMILYGYNALKQFPKSEKFALAADIKGSMQKLLRLTITCNKRYYKKTTLQDLDIELDVLRSYVRLAQKLNYLKFHPYEVWSRNLDEIGKMIGGWIKSINVKD